jgi:hypothetical protein
MYDTGTCTTGIIYRYRLLPPAIKPDLETRVQIQIRQNISDHFQLQYRYIVKAKDWHLLQKRYRICYCMSTPVHCAVCKSYGEGLGARSNRFLHRWKRYCTIRSFEPGDF